MFYIKKIDACKSLDFFILYIDCDYISSILRFAHHALDLGIGYRSKDRLAVYFLHSIVGVMN